ncbi:hypothetical protein QLX08_004555 [Tetragonisca angustula]|uniref:Uncharacterized protein n=1 Tax=Tetragonisca angustula TaxID=166442 RepID=A0AAW1A1Q7_9HYME
MENNSDSCEEQKVLSDTNNRVIKTKENSLRLKLVRVFSSSALKSPKSPLSVSSSQSSTPSCDISPRVKARYSWHLPLCKEYLTLRALENVASPDSTISSNSTNSPTSSSSPRVPCSTWYVSER